jgi:metal-dependent hydrolase (beta-lactamase superfamily II)
VTVAEHEHGFSVYFVAEGIKLLFDTGLSISVAHNAKLQWIDLASGSVALIHGHYDHTSELAGILKTAGPRKVFCHSDLFSVKYGELQGVIRPLRIHQGREGDGKCELSLSNKEQPQRKYNPSHCQYEH